MSNKASNLDLFVATKEICHKRLTFDISQYLHKYSAHSPPAWTALILSKKEQDICGNGEGRSLELSDGRNAQG